MKRIFYSAPLLVFLIIIAAALLSFCSYELGTIHNRFIAVPSNTILRENIEVTEDFLHIKLDGKFYVTTVKDTGSMRPLLDAGRWIVMEITKDVSIGDIAIYSTPDGRSAIHRIVGEVDGKWIFKGDNNPQSDAPVDKEWVTDRLVIVIY
jgi:hypothetical protein